MATLAVQFADVIALQPDASFVCRNGGDHDKIVEQAKSERLALGLDVENSYVLCLRCRCKVKL